MPVSDWSTNPAENTTVGGVFIGENCPAQNVNNGDRAIMAEAKAKFDQLDQSISAIDLTVDPTLKAIGDLVTSANTLAYFTGEDTAALTGLSAFARTILDDPDAAAVAATIGAVRVLASSLSNPGYVKFAIGAGSFMIQWGTSNFPANSYKTITYPAAFSSFSIPLVSGARTDTGAQDNNPATASAGTTSFAAFSASDTPVNGFWIAVGV